MGIGTAKQRLKNLIKVLDDQEAELSKTLQSQILSGNPYATLTNTNRDNLAAIKTYCYQIMVDLNDSEDKLDEIISLIQNKLREN